MEKSNIPDEGELLLGEDKAHVVLDVRQQALQIRILLQMAPDGLPHHCVLAHEDDSLAAQRNPDLLHPGFEKTVFFIYIKTQPSGFSEFGVF